MKINYELLNDDEDKDINELKSIHQSESIKKYINVSDNYFDYVITTENVFFYKIKIEDELVGALHLEKDNLTLYLSILIKPEKQRLGIASDVIQDVIDNRFNIDFTKILIYIDKDNGKSIKLFKKMKFIQTQKTDDELIEFVFNK